VEWPLTAGKFEQWVSAVNGNGNMVNLFMDYETLGEHQWEDTGIFEFVKHLPEEVPEAAACPPEKIEGLRIDGAYRVFFSPFDMAAGWQGDDHPLACGYERGDALLLGANLVTYCLTH